MPEGLSAADVREEIAEHREHATADPAWCDHAMAILDTRAAAGRQLFIGEKERSEGRCVTTAGPER